MSDTASPSRAEKPRPLWRYVLFAPLLLLPFALLKIPAVQSGLFALLAAMREGGAKGAVLYVLTYAVAALVASPIALMSALAGYAYGPVKGVLLASPASVLGACTALLAGRLFARLLRRDSPTHDPRIALLRDLVEAEGFRVTLLLRLTPVAPQNFLPYALAPTKLSVGRFALATWIGLFPITCLQVYAGSLLESAAAVLRGEAGPQGAMRWASPLAGLLISAVMAALIARTAKRTLERIVAERSAQHAREREATQAPGPKGPTP